MTAHMIKNVIFDWSGVISNNITAAHCAANAVFRAYGIKEHTFDQFREKWEAPYMVYYNRYIPKLTLEEEKKIYHKAILECPKSSIYPGVKEVLENLRKAGISLVVLSSDPPKTVTTEMKEFGLQGIFDEVISDIHDKSEKIEEIMSNHNLIPEQTLIIGDTTLEIAAGKLVGIKTVAATWGFQKEKKLRSANPDMVIHNIQELEKHILDNK